MRLKWQTELLVLSAPAWGIALEFRIDDAARSRRTPSLHPHDQIAEARAIDASYATRA